ncbi:MAG: TetR/AcrR family transcriptional regulator, partial [Gammaproteobacteria bacterium]|nr:TetR/AcrR family transcriptional regulator [Gammaproteobacteria bacterium]
MDGRQAKLDTSENVRERILEAANVRFQQYGYNKTTMAEIAGDCKMSA